MTSSSDITLYTFGQPSFTPECTVIVDTSCLLRYSERLQGAQYFLSECDCGEADFLAQASVTLEELGLPYKKEILNISTNVQKEQWFLDSECVKLRCVPQLTGRIATLTASLCFLSLY